MKHFLFVERISGEEFLVGAENLDDAWIIAEDVARSIAEQWNTDVDDYELLYADILDDFEKFLIPITFTSIFYYFYLCNIFSIYNIYYFSFFGCFSFFSNIYIHSYNCCI